MSRLPVIITLLALPLATLVGCDDESKPAGSSASAKTPSSDRPKTKEQKDAKADDKAVTLPKRPSGAKTVSCQITYDAKLGQCFEKVIAKSKYEAKKKFAKLTCDEMEGHKVEFKEEPCPDEDATGYCFANPQASDLEAIGLVSWATVTYGDEPSPDARQRCERSGGSPPDRKGIWSKTR